MPCAGGLRDRPPQPPPCRRHLPASPRFSPTGDTGDRDAVTAEADVGSPIFTPSGGETRGSSRARLGAFLLGTRTHATAPREVSCALTGKRERENRLATL